MKRQTKSKRNSASTANPNDARKRGKTESKILASSTPPAAPASQFNLLKGWDASSDPIDGNPFPKDSPRHNVWRKATLTAEEELHRLNSQFLEITALSPSEFDARACASTGAKFDIWARRHIQIVWNERDLDRYDRWLFAYAESWLKLWKETASHGPGFIIKVQSNLVSRMEYWKAEARRYLTLQREHLAKADKESASATANQESAHRDSAQQPQLDDRERQIWNVIQRGSKGLQYCRELDGACIRHRRAGIWKGAPLTYSAAYQAGEPWRHRIQDEKSKIKRKAQLAGLAPTLASE